MAKKKPTRGSARNVPAHKPSAVRPAKTPESIRSSARSTTSGPSAKSKAFDPGDAAARKMAAVGALAAAMPENPTKAGEYGDASRRPRDGRACRASRSRGHRQYAHRDESFGQGWLGRASRRLQRRKRTARSRACRLRRSCDHHEPGRAGRRQSEFPEGRPARSRAAGRFHPARENHAFRPRAHSRAHRARARFRRLTDISNVTSR